MVVSRSLMIPLKLWHTSALEFASSSSMDVQISLVLCDLVYIMHAVKKTTTLLLTVASANVGPFQNSVTVWFVSKCGIKWLFIDSFTASSMYCATTLWNNDVINLHKSFAVALLVWNKCDYFYFYFQFYVNKCRQHLCKQFNQVTVSQDLATQNSCWRNTRPVMWTYMAYLQKNYL